MTRTLASLLIPLAIIIIVLALVAGLVLVVAAAILESWSVALAAAVAFWAGFRGLGFLHTSSARAIRQGTLEAIRSRLERVTEAGETIQ